MENSTETNAVNSGEQTEVVDQSQSQNNDGQGEVVDTHEQSKEDNHAAKRARLKAEREAKANAEKMANERLAKLLKESGVENPYTDKPFESVEEFTEYGKKVREAKLKERAEESGKTIDEIKEEDEAKALLREKKKKEESDRVAEREQEHINNDIKEFIEEYPDVDVEKLINNKMFIKFCGSRLGHEPLYELYSDFSELVDVSEKAGVAKRDTRSERSTGSGSNGGERLTVAQQKALEDWNNSVPKELRMTPADYIKRKGKN